jgi:hypothetical protein
MTDDQLMAELTMFHHREAARRLLALKAEVEALKRQIVKLELNKD